MFEPLTDASIGVVVALPRETRGWGRRALAAGSPEPAGRFRVRVSGPGVEQARIAARQLLDDGAAALVSWGMAGGLAEDLQAGDLMLAERTVSECGSWYVTASWRRQQLSFLQQAGLAPIAGTLWTSRWVVRSTAEKKQLGARGYVATDMEAAAVAEVAVQAGVPFLAVKAVCDAASHAIPEFAEHLVDDEGAVRIGPLLGSLAHGPDGWRQLSQMGRDARRACVTLGRVAALWRQPC